MLSLTRYYYSRTCYLPITMPASTTSLLQDYCIQVCCKEKRDPIISWRYSHFKAIKKRQPTHILILNSVISTLRRIMCHTLIYIYFFFLKCQPMYMLDLTVFYSKDLKILNRLIIKLLLTQDSNIVLNCKNTVNFFEITISLHISLKDDLIY